jgi:hypothetical protein
MTSRGEIVVSTLDGISVLGKGNATSSNLFNLYLQLASGAYVFTQPSIRTSQAGR